MSENKPVPVKMETQSIEKLKQLHPKIRQYALDAYAEAVRVTPVGVHPYITETIRSFHRSDELYAQGRTTKGNIVTNAKAGQSYHNYGLAIDFVLQVNGKIVWDVNDNWMKVVKCFKQKGFAWGGDFKSIKDYPHFEMTIGHKWTDLLDLHNKGKVDKYGYVLI